MRKSLFRIMLGCAIALMAFVPAANAQVVTGSITGQVTDPSGAVISGALVTAHAVETGIETATTTNAQGQYHIEFLPIGHYKVTVQANGFATATVPEFSLEVRQTANFNVKLQVGSTNTSVNVSAAAPILQTESLSVDSTFTANTIQNLPLNGLDFSALTLYVPGSVIPRDVAGPTSFERSTYYTDTPNMNGNRAQANQLHARRNRHERELQQPDLLQPGARSAPGGPGDHGQFVQPTTAT